MDVVFTALPMPPHVKVVLDDIFGSLNGNSGPSILSNTPQAVFEGDTGLLSGLAGKVWVDHSTTDYEQVLSIRSYPCHCTIQINTEVITNSHVSLTCIIFFHNDSAQLIVVFYPINHFVSLFYRRRR